MNPSILTRLVPAAALSAALFCVAPATAQLVQAYHDVDGATHQAQWNALTNQGYRPLTLSVYGTTNDLRYAAVWIQRAGPQFTGFHGLDAAAYQAFVNQWAPQGYTPSILTATGTAGNPRFAGVFERTNQPIYARHGLTEQQFWDELTAARDLGYQIRTADIYNTNADPRYVVAYSPSDAGRGVFVSGSVASFQTHFDAGVAGYARPSLIAFNDDDRFVSFWESDSVGASVVHHDMTSAQYQNFFNTYKQQGMFPISLQASGSGNARRFAAVWATTDVPVQRQFTATGQAVAALAGFDQYVHDWMVQNDARAASLAVVKNGRLVLARGYTYAEPGYPTTQPTSVFRIASCSKPLTSIAMHQHYVARPNAIWPGRSMLDYFVGASPFDSRTDDITLDHLLTHRGGWDRDVSFDAMFRDVTISQALNIPLPIGKGDVFQYMTEQVQLDFTPGTQSKYSNYGFSIAGQVLEKLNPGFGYAQIMQRDVFGPLGITRARIGGAPKTEALPMEVRYHPKDPWIGRSVNDPTRPWVPGQYGAFNLTNMDSHGAWVMAAADYAKVLGAFDLGNGNPLLSTATANQMWSVAPGTSTTLRGWFLKNVSDGKGGTVRMVHHNGKLSGAASVIAHRDDGLSFVLLTNSDTSMFGTVEGVALSNLANTVSIWPNHDLFPTLSLPPFRSRLQGTMTNYGSGCRGSAGVPSLRGAGIPETGQRFDLELGGAQAGVSAVALVGFARTSVDLTSLGATGCRLLCSPAASFGATTSRAGAATVGLLVPDDTTLLGLHLDCQFAVLDAAANGLGLTTTEGLDVMLGGWR